MGGSHSSVRRGALVALVAVGTIALAGSAVTIPPPPQAYAGWPHQLGGVDTDLASKVATLSSGDVIVVGSTTGTMPNGSPHGFNDGYIARLDKGGSVKWLRQIGTTGQDGASAVAVSGSSIYVAGGTDGTFPNTSPLGGTDTYVTRYDTNGNFKWLRLL